MQRNVIALLLISVLLAGCGQMGPLYLPNSPQAKQQAKYDSHQQQT